MSTEIKLCKAQLFKIIQSEGFIGNMIGKIAKKTMTNVASLFIRYHLSGSVNNMASNAL